MTEREWVVCAEPDRMLRFLGHRADARKVRLFACACCRRAWHLLPEGRARELLDVAEAVADQGTGVSAFGPLVPRRPKFTLTRTPLAPESPAAYATRAVELLSWRADAVAEVARWAGESAAEALARAAKSPHEQWAVREAEWAAQADLLRDVIGNPFRP